MSLRNLKPVYYGTKRNQKSSNAKKVLIDCGLEDDKSDEEMGNLILTDDMPPVLSEAEPELAVSIPSEVVPEADASDEDSDEDLTISELVEQATLAN
jgi:hypothetical protein